MSMDKEEVNGIKMHDPHYILAYVDNRFTLKYDAREYQIKCS